jgi:hypothetical protein
MKVQDARSWVSLVAGDPDASMTWQLFDDTAERDPRKARILHGTLSEVGGELLRANLDGSGVFAAVNACDGNGRKSANVQAVRALFVDFDHAVEPTWHVPPSFTVQSGSGPHGYWLVDDCPLDGFARAQKRLAAHYGSDPVVHDLARVMRVAGFWHCKREPRKAVTIHAGTCGTYKLADILRDVPELPVADAPPRQRLATQEATVSWWRNVDALRAFRESGLYGREIAYGKHAILCPWIHEHTQRDFTARSADTVLWETSTDGAAVFHCSHAHCAGRYLVHALAEIGAMLL